MKYFPALFLLLLTSQNIHALTGFNATYQLSLNSEIKGTTQFNLRIDPGNNYSFEAFTEPAGAVPLADGTNEVLESSHGHYTESKILPDSYYYALRKKSGTHMLELFFNWKKKNVLFRDAKIQEQYPLEENTQDHLSYLLQAMLLGASHLHELRFPQLNVTGLQKVTLSKKLQRFISTPAGRYLGLKIEITVENEPQPRILWLAPKQAYLPLLLERKSQAGLVRMELIKVIPK